MSDFRYKGYNFNLTSFREFVQEYNIMDNQRASADALNKSVNKLWMILSSASSSKAVAIFKIVF